jgi:hypothetical protein
MQINSINHNTNPNFGMALKMTPEAFERVTSKIKNVKDWVEFESIITRQAHNDVADIFVSVTDVIPRKARITARVGTQNFEEGLMGGVITPLRNASDYAKNIEARTHAVKLEADSEFLEKLRNRVEVLPPQKPVDVVGNPADEVVQLTGEGDSFVGHAFDAEV